MGRVIVIEFMTLDGVVQDPDGSEGSEYGGWAFRFGREAVTGDPFKLGETLETGVLLLGRATWQFFTGVWPSMTDDFANKMNAIPKLVASHSLDRVDEWNNSTLLTGDLVAEVSMRKQQDELVVMGSTSVVETLMEHDLIDEYRLLVFPIVIGEGRRLFEKDGRLSGQGIAPFDLQLMETGTAGAAVRLVYTRARPT